MDKANSINSINLGTKDNTSDDHFRPLLNMQNSVDENRTSMGPRIMQESLLNQTNQTGVSKRSTMAYKEMNHCVYISVTLSVFIFQIVGAIVIGDIGVLFEFVSAIAYSNLSFIFPGLFFLLAERKYGLSS